MSSAFGSLPTNEFWRIGVELTGPDKGLVPPGEWTVDPYVPVVSTDRIEPNGGIQIPAGRFVAIGYANGTSHGLTSAGKAPITPCDGKTFAPYGMAVNNLFRVTEEFLTDPNTVKLKKQFIAQVPYNLSINTANGTPYAGDKMTGYWGSTTSTTVVNWAQRGRPVKWVAKTLNTQTGSASASMILTSAVYPGITPRVVASYASGMATGTPSGYTYSFNGTAWVANGMPTNVTEVLYEYGHSEAMIAGQAQNIRSISNILADDPFLRWVEFDKQFPYNMFSPALQRSPKTAVSNETPATVTANARYRVAYYPMDLFSPVTVQVSNATVLEAGESTSYNAGTWYTLPSGPMLDVRSSFIGRYHSINWFTGLIDIASNIQPITGSSISIRISYSYISDLERGAVSWGAGVYGLTDGSNITLGQTSGGTAVTPSTNAYGVPAQLNVTDTVGALSVFVN